MVCHVLETSEFSQGRSTSPRPSVDTTMLTEITHTHTNKQTNKQTTGAALMGVIILKKQQNKTKQKKEST